MRASGTADHSASQYCVALQTLLVLHTPALPAAIYEETALAFLTSLIACVQNVLAAVDVWLLVGCCYTTVCGYLQLQPGPREGVCARPCVSHAAHTSSFPEVSEPECWVFRLVCAGRGLAEQFAVQAGAYFFEESQCRVSTLHCEPCAAVCLKHLP